MELLTLLAGWVRVSLADGLHLRAPRLPGRVTLRERVQPIPRLRALACGFGQGYWFSIPVEPGEVPALLARALPA